MLAPILHKFLSALRQTVPVLTTLVFIFAGTLVWPIPYIGAMTPSFGLASLYYWSLHRPDLMRPYVAFLLGLLADALNFMPLGLTAFVFVGVYQLSVSQRRFFVGQFFPMLWFGFSLIALLASLAQWLFLSVMGDNLVPIMPVLFQCLLSVTLFPLPAWVLIKVQKALLTGEPHVP